MIFTMRQLVEKCLEHKSKAFLTVIDLKIAYDSVPRQAMGKALEKLGVPEEPIWLISFCHQDMKAKFVWMEQCWKRLRFKMVCDKVVVWLQCCSTCTRV